MTLPMQRTLARVRYFFFGLFLALTLLVFGVLALDSVLLLVVWLVWLPLGGAIGAACFAPSCWPPGRGRSKRRG